MIYLLNERLYSKLWERDFWWLHFIMELSVWKNDNVENFNISLNIQNYYGTIFVLWEIEKKIVEYQLHKFSLGMGDSKVTHE